MTTSIIVKLHIEGLHSWPEAREKLPEVAFLSDPHRHIFHIKCEKFVTHSDRDVEIIMFKRIIKSFIYEKYFQLPTACVDFGRMSCEEIAEELVDKFGLSFCEVLEDGENGAVIRRDDLSIPLELVTEEILDEPRIMFVCGYICAGKTTLSQQIQATTPSSMHIEVSSIVKALLKSTNRTKLQDSAELDLSIISVIDSQIKASVGIKNLIIVSGPRQVSILKAFPEADILWIEVSSQERFKRFQNRKGEKDSDLSKESFDLAEYRDRKLGVYRVKQHIANQELINYEK